MGCISSKALCRSISIREELNHGFQSSGWEDLITSKDHLFALMISSSSSSSSKPTSSGSFKLPSTTDVQTNNSSSSSSGDLDGDWSPDHGGLRRSKSCQLPRESENNKKLDRLGSRSFHTVEEYDALLHKLSAMEEDVRFNSCVEEPSKDSPKRGWKRKALGKGLKSLHVPPTIDFPTFNNSPTSYATPKFGSYNDEDKEPGETRAFSPELVAVFEDCMHQLQLEQDTILRELEELVDDDEIDPQ